MFFKRELNVISGKKSISAKELNAAMDVVGLPYGFQYSKRFLLFGIEWVHKVEKVGNKSYRVPSESKAGKFYSVCLDPLSCECPAFQRFKVTPYPYCKHVVAAMVKEQDVTDLFFDWLIEKDKSDVSDFDDYITAHQAPTVTVFSSSQLDCYTRCPASYYFRYQKRVPDESPLSSALAFDRSLKATIYAHFGIEIAPNIPLEEKWKPELDIAVDAMSEGINIDAVFVETFQWLCGKFDVEWSSDTEEGDMLKRGGILAKEFLKRFGIISAQPLVSMQTTMVDKSTGALVQSNGSPVSVQCSLDLVSNDGVILKLKTSSRSISKLEYDWALDLQRYVYEQTKREPPAGVKVVNLVRTKKPKMQVLDAPEPKLSRTLAICESVIASINAGAFYPNPKNQFGCSKCGYVSVCEEQW